MIKVFNGAWRGLGETEDRKGLILDFQFRKIIHHFKGAKLHVFMAICLHVDEDGFCYPSYDTLERETGYGRATIAKAIRELCEMTIDDHRVLAKWRQRDDDGQFAGSNRYRIFPTQEELKSIDNQSSVNPTLDKSNCGESEPEVKPSVKVKPVTCASGTQTSDQLAFDGMEPPETTPDPKRKMTDEQYEIYQGHLSALAKVCTGKPFGRNTLSHGLFNGIIKIAKKLTFNGYKPRDVLIFGKWWAEQDWATTRPNPSTVLDRIEDALEWYRQNPAFANNTVAIRDVHRNEAGKVVAVDVKYQRRKYRVYADNRVKERMSGGGWGDCLRLPFEPQDVLAQAI